VFIVQAYQTSQYVVPGGGIFLGKWRSSLAGSSDGKMNVQLACALNTRYNKGITWGTKINALLKSKSLKLSSKCKILNSRNCGSLLLVFASRTQSAEILPML
jgi:hypothetical protein